MKYITKTNYVDYMECLNRAYLDTYKLSEKQDQKLENNVYVQGGIEAGAKARAIFGPYTLIIGGQEKKIEDLIRITNESMNSGDKVICEATFCYENNVCRVDILRQNDDGTVSIYEVKGTTNPYTTERHTKLEAKYVNDIAFQYFVLSKCGLNIKNVNIIYLNNKYIYDGTYDLNQLFIIEDLTELIEKESQNVEANLTILNEMIRHAEEPEIVFASKKCKECPYNNHCYKKVGLPEKNNVLNLYNDKKKYDYLNNGIKSFKDLIDNNISLSSFNQRMVDYKFNNKEPFIDFKELRYFLNQFKYPLYFFDFETFQEAIPKIRNTRPFQQVPFQYSLHIINEDGSLEHKEYLASNYDDPRTDLVKQMLRDLGAEGTIIAYNDSFEKSRIKELANDYPEYQNQLLALLDRFKDLEDVFKNEMYYCKEISRTSIKDTLPSLFPNDSSLDYHNLDDVHKGDEASKAYLFLKTLDKEQELKLRTSLLKYCELDTYAMVKIYTYLRTILEKEGK